MISTVKIGIIGCMGRMGQALLHCVANDEQTHIAGGLTIASDEAIGRDIGLVLGEYSLGISITSDVAEFMQACDVVIDFTSPAATLANLAIAKQYEVAYVTGTTGFSLEEKQQLQEFADVVPLVWSANMSVGINILKDLVEKVAATLDELSDIEVVEMHHRAKVDAPSGTALLLGEAAAKGRDVALEKVACRSRDGIVGARKAGEIGFATLRGGDVVGDHTVIFASQGERLELTHKASSREIFALGAVRAAKWLADKPPGFYGMSDVLTL